MALETNGFFSVPKIAVTALMDSSATAKQIGGYLVLAKFTDSTGVFSRAGKKAISTYLGVGDGAAGEIVTALKSIEVKTGIWPAGEQPRSLRLVMDVNEWLSKEPVGGEASEESCTGKAKGPGGKVQWIVNDFGTSSGDKVWFPNSIVAGTEKFANPLKRLVWTKSDAMVRALLLLYSEQDVEQVGGVRPCRTGYIPYTASKLKAVDNLNIAEVTRSSGFVFDPSFSKKVIGADGGNDQAVSKIIDRLEREGFIYRAVTVLDGSPQLGETEALYCLDTKSACDSTIGASDDTLVGEINAFTKAHGIDCADSIGRFYTKYPVVLPEDYQTHVAEIIRLRFRINDESVDIVNQALARGKASHALTRSLIGLGADDVSTDVQNCDNSVQYESFVAKMEASDTNSGNKEIISDALGKENGGEITSRLRKGRSVDGDRRTRSERWRDYVNVEITF